MKALCVHKNQNKFPKALGLMCVAFFWLAGCQLSNNEPAAKAPSPVKMNVSAVENIKTKSPLANALLTSPEVSSAVIRARVARSNVAVAYTAKATKVDLTGSSGLAAEKYTKPTGLSQGTLSAYRLLFDGNQTNRTIAIAALAADTAALQAELTSDQTLGAMILAFSAERAAQESIQIIDKYLVQYDQREALIQSAVSSGVISNSDYLELRALRNDVASQRARAELTERSATATLELLMPENLEASTEVIRAALGERFNLVQLVTNSPQSKIIDAQAITLELNIENLRSKKRPLAKLQTAITSPKDSASEATLFAGVNVTFPIRDGGETDARITSLEIEAQSVAFDRKALKNRIDNALSSWKEFSRFYDTQVEILDERLDIAIERISDLELRLSAGKADIGSLAKEILSAAQAEVSLVQLENEWAKEAVNAAATSTQTCAVVFICEYLSKGLGQAFQ